nr:unnamed protein product [Spirometra erinaceieuropaei]
MQGTWMVCKAENIQGYADYNATEKVLVPIKAVYGPEAKETAPLLSSGETTLTDKTHILKRWAEPFEGVLNRSSTIADDTTERCPEIETNNDLDLPPSISEATVVVHQLFSEDPLGANAILVDV